jgi:hypothetical protein
MDTGKLLAVIPPLPMTFQGIQNYLCAKFLKNYVKTMEGSKIPVVVRKAGGGSLKDR